MKPVKVIAAIILVGLSVSLVAVGRHTFGPKGRPTFDPRISSRSKGNPQAPLWIVEYVDFQCKSCALSVPIIGEFMNEHPGRVYLQLRFHPLPNAHRHAVRAAVYGECAAKQKKFWPMHDLLFGKQDEWIESENPDVFYNRYAAEAGLDIGRLSACVEDPATKATIMAEKEEAAAIGVNSTPTFFLNGKMMVGIVGLKEALATHADVKKKGSV